MSITMRKMIDPNLPLYGLLVIGMNLVQGRLRARYTLEFKQDAVRLVESGQSIAAAARVGPLHARAKHQSLHHFVAKVRWSDRALLRRVALWVVQLMDFSAGG